MRFRPNSNGIFSPGQSSQGPGMGEVSSATEEGKMVFNTASEITGLDMAEICFGSQTDRLDETLVAQTAIGAAWISDYLYLKKLGFRPNVGVGHSVGELPLFAMAGILPVKETIQLMQIRAEATSKASEERPGMMAAISGLTAEQLKTKSAAIRASGRAAITNFNGKTQQVFSGDHGPMEELETLVGQWRLHDRLRVRFDKLRTGGAFHSAYHMENAVGEVYEAAAALKYSPAEFELMLNNVLYLSELGTANLPRYVSGQLVTEVYFAGSSERVIDDGVTNFVEVGPLQPDTKLRTLSSLVKRDFEDRVHIIEINELGNGKSVKATSST